MKSNIVIKALAVLVVVVLVVVIAKGRKSENNADGAGVENLPLAEKGPSQEDNGLSADLFGEKFLEDEYGVDVDSPTETMRTLTNETRALRIENDALQEENKKKTQEIDRLLKMERKP